MGALIHPAEMLTISGAALGALFMMSPKKVLLDLWHGVITAFRGSRYDKRMCTELLMVSYHLLRIARRDGLLALDRHVTFPHESEVFKRYPRIASDHQVWGYRRNGFD